MAWINEQRRIYFGNASSVRDFRAQLRGTRPALFWTLYLGLLILFVTLAYSNIVAQGEQSITVVQLQLKSFYISVLGMLELMIALVAPVIVGMSIQAEVQRKSLDLVVTAPVSPKYFLVGKVLSGYRYILMLLFLSLPIAAAAVMLGGATWGEVLVSYLLLAMHGLFYIGISLPIAVISTKVVPAVIYSYMACWAWAFGSAGPVTMAFAMSGGGGTFSRQEAPFFTLMFPGAFALGVDSYTTMFGAQVPNWILATLTTLIVVKFFITGAGSAMTRIGSKETVSLRIHGLVVAAILTTAFCLSVFGSGAFGADPANELAIFLSILTVPIVFALPHLSTWSYVDERRHRPHVPFSLRHILDGKPDGGLPYIYALLTTIVGVTLLIWSLLGRSIPLEAIVYMFWLYGAWTFLWSMGWVVSAFAKSGIGTSRKSHLAFTIIVALLPWPVLSIFAAMLQADPVEVFRIYPVAGLGYNSTELSTVGFMAVEFWVVALWLTYWAEKRRRSIVSFINRVESNERQAA